MISERLMGSPFKFRQEVVYHFAMGIEEAPLGLAPEGKIGFEAFYAQYYPWVYSYFRRRGFRPETCSEFTQEVFLRVYDHGMHREPPARLVPWMITVVRNMAVSEFRLRMTRELPQMDSSKIDSASTRGPDPEEALAGEERSQGLGARIARLPEMVRRCLILRYYHDLSPDEAADMLSLSVNTVKTHLKRGLQMLRMDLADEAGF
jgi:RNA polymerase sigma factor (sigma-70 family)